MLPIIQGGDSIPVELKTRCRMFQKLSLLGLCVAASLLVGCGSGGDTTPATTGPGSAGPAPAKQEITIAVIPKGTTHPYWKSVKAGAEAAGTELGVKIQW